ncbi:MAG: glycosyltransferase [Candidatus Eisenbacteria sp.]|nr:glycosyltransferase [Candidatus Eisenbacteria bacterium]
MPDTLPGGQPWPRVGIVTPSFNQGQFIEETIRSVLLQGYPDLEYIIVDGGSTDGSVDIIRKYEPWLAYWVSEPDRGQSQAINMGFRRSKGDILAWLNSDDLLEPLAVCMAAAYLTVHPEVGMVYGDRTIVDSTGNRISYRLSPSFYRWQLRYRSGIAQESAFFRRDLFYAVGELDESLHYSMDYDLWWRFIRRTRIHHLPVLMGGYRAHEASKSIMVARPNNTAEYVGRLRSEVLRVRRKYMGRDCNSFERKILPLVWKGMEYLERLSGYKHRKWARAHRLRERAMGG